MIQQVADSLSVTQVADTIQATTSSEGGGTYRITPYQVLRMLPRDATPEQQDSAIQAWFQPEQIRYSNRPDTLHLPGHDIPVDLKKVDIPLYYREVFFAKELTVPEAVPSKYGVPGDPVPYTVRNDDTITMLLIFCFITFIVTLGHAHRFIIRQLKNFFFITHNDELMTETKGEIRLQLFLAMQTCLLLAICSFFYANHYVSDTYFLDSDLQLIGLYFILFILFFSLQSLLYWNVNRLFFDDKSNLQWWRASLFLTAASGVLLFPAVLLQVYFSISLENVTFYYLFVLILYLSLTFYKAWDIFFRQNVFSLQIILYFCALEIVPLLAFTGCWWIVTNMLKVNF